MFYNKKKKLMIISKKKFNKQHFFFSKPKLLSLSYPSQMFDIPIEQFSYPFFSWTFEVYPKCSITLEKHLNFSVISANLIPFPSL
jgi:hypothetical protein